MECPACKFQNENGKNFCGNCGQSIKEPKSHLENHHQSSLDYKTGYHEGNLSIGQETAASGSQRDMKTNIEAGYFTGNIEVKQTESDPPSQNTNSKANIQEVAVSKDFSPDNKLTTEQPVLKLIIEVKKGFKEGCMTDGLIHVTNLSDRAMKNVKVSIEEHFDNTLKAKSVSIRSIQPRKRHSEKTYFYPIGMGRVPFKFIVEYESGDDNPPLLYSSLADIFVVDRYEAQPREASQIINNTFRIGYIDGNISLEPDYTPPPSKPSEPKLSSFKCCYCPEKIPQDADVCNVCGSQVFWWCPSCQEKVTPEHHTCPKCGNELHRKIQLKLHKIKSCESSNSVRTMLMVQQKRWENETWDTSQKYLLVCNTSCYRMGRVIEIDDETLYNDIVLIVHCTNEPDCNQWNKNRSKTDLNSSQVSRRQIDIFFKDGCFHICAKRPGVIVIRDTNTNNGKRTESLEIESEFTLHNNDIIEIKNKLKFRFQLIKRELNGNLQTTGACLKRVVIDTDEQQSFKCKGKESNPHKHREVADENNVGLNEYEHYFNACYIFPKTLLIGGVGTEGLAIDCPSLVANRFEIVVHEGELNLVDRKRKDQSPREKIICC